MSYHDDAHLSRAQAAEFLAVSPHVVSMWATRGWLTRDGTRRHLATTMADTGQRLYRLGDLLAAERDTRGNPRSHRPLRIDLEAELAA